MAEQMSNQENVCYRSGLPRRRIGDGYDGERITRSLTWSDESSAAGEIRTTWNSYDADLIRTIGKRWTNRGRRRESGFQTIRWWSLVWRWGHSYWLRQETAKTRKMTKLLSPSSIKDRALPIATRYISFRVSDGTKRSNLTLCPGKCFTWRRWGNGGRWWKMLNSFEWWIDWRNRGWLWVSRREQRRLLECVCTCSNDCF